MSTADVAFLLVATHSLCYFAGWVMGLYSKDDE